MIKPELMTLAELTAQLMRPYAAYNLKPEVVSSASAVRRYALLLQVEDTYSSFSPMSMEERLAREMLESIRAFSNVANAASDDSLACMLRKLGDQLADICASYPEQDDNKEPF